MRENKLRVKIPATAESSRSSGQSILFSDRVRKDVPAVAQCNCGGGRSHYNNRDGRLRFLRAKWPTTLV